MPNINYSDQKLLSVPKLYNCHFINEEHSKRHSRLVHSHDNFLELFYVYKGEGFYFVDNIRYAIKEGDIVICNAGILHGEEPQDHRRVRSYCVGIGEVKYPNLPDNWICENTINPIISCGKFADNIKEIFALIYKYSDSGTNINDSCHALSLSLLMLTSELIQKQNTQPVTHKRSSAHATAERIRSYMNSHYKEALTLQEIADALHLNEYYLSHTFKEEYGVSPIQYAMKRRIGEAQGLLMDSSLSLGDISDMLGFGGTAHFNRMFKKHVGIPPGEYRNSFKNMEE